jgi:hypothetical protein
MRVTSHESRVTSVEPSIGLSLPRRPETRDPGLETADGVGA